MKGHKIIAPIASPLFARSAIHTYIATENTYLDVRVAISDITVEMPDFSYTNRVKAILKPQEIQDFQMIYSRLLKIHVPQIVSHPTHISFNLTSKDCSPQELFSSMIGSLLYILYESTQKQDGFQFWLSQLDEIQSDKTYSSHIITSLLGGIQHCFHGKELIHKRWSLPAGWDIIRLKTATDNAKLDENLMSLLGVSFMSFDLKSIEKVLHSMTSKTQFSDLINNDSMMKAHIYGAIQGQDYLTFISTQTNARDRFLKSLDAQKTKYQVLKISDGIYRM